MGRNEATPPRRSRGTSQGPLPERASPRGWSSPLAKTSAVAAALLVLLGVAVFTRGREATTSRPAPSSLQRVSVPSRPALTPEEEKYIRAMWPIHGDIERSTMRASLGQIFYKTQDLKREELKRRLEQALAVYRRAEDRVRSLQPPASLRREHDEYVSAVQLFRESAIEGLKMFEDGREDHLLAAYPKSQKGSDKIREVGGKFWPNEFPAN
jgi:hypothetical protein